MRAKENGWFVALMASLTILLTDSERWSTAREAVLLGGLEAIFMGCFLLLVWFTAPVWQTAPVLKCLFAGYLLFAGGAAAVDFWQFYKTVFPRQIGCWAFLGLVLAAAMLLGEGQRGSLENMAKILAALSAVALLIMLVSGWPVFHWENLSTVELSYPWLVHVRFLPEYLILCGLLRPKSPKAIFGLPGVFWGIQAALAVITELALGSTAGKDFPIYSVALLGKISVFNRLEGIQVLCWLLLLCLKTALFLWAVKQLYPKGKPWVSALLIAAFAAAFIRLPAGAAMPWLNAAGWLLALIILTRGICGWKSLQSCWQRSCRE